jgi:uncharacterized protein involved in exopolysaccharide biosynthesis
MDAKITANDIKGLFRRQWKLFILLFSIIFLGMTILAIALPPIFRSQAVILIEEQQIPDEYVKSTITSYAEQRLESISREILGSAALKKIIKEIDLYPEYRLNGDIGMAVQEMKEALVVEPISSKVGANKSVTVAFNLSYEGKDPKKVFMVTDQISKLYLQKESEARENQAAVTTRFMEAELENLRKQIEKYEKIVSEFKQQHIGELPGSASANLNTLQRLERDLDRINSRIRTLQDRKIYLKGQLANIEPLKPIQTQDGKVASNPRERLKRLRLELIRLSSRLSDKHPDIKKRKREIEDLERQVGSVDVAVVKVKKLKRMRAQLAELKANKGEKHPDILNLSNEIQRLSQEVDKLLTDKAMVEVSEQRPDNPLYVDLMTQVVSADTEINNLNQDTIKINEMIEEYQRKIEHAPIVEKEYNELTLDYANAKKRYHEILNKLLEARVAQEMESQQQGERFSITDPAYLPSKPYKPNRLAIVLLGLVLATGAGLGGAAFKEATDHTIKSSTEIAKFEGVDLLVTMPYTPTSEESRHQLFKRLATVTWCMGIVGIVLVAVDRLVYPLGDVISIVFERLVN